MSKIYTVNDSYFCGSYCTNSQKMCLLKTNNAFLKMVGFSKK